MADVEHVEGAEGDDRASTHAGSLVAARTARPAVPRVATVSPPATSCAASSPPTPAARASRSTTTPTPPPAASASSCPPGCSPTGSPRPPTSSRRTSTSPRARSSVLDLPPHWRTLYWALAVWSVGACVELPAHRSAEARSDAGPPTPAGPPECRGHPGCRRPDGRPTWTGPRHGRPRAAAGGRDHAVLVTLAALARSARRHGARRRGRRGQGPRDARGRLRPVGRARPGDPALRTADGETSYAELVPDRAAGGRGCTRRPPTRRRSCARPGASGPATARSSLGRGEPTRTCSPRGSRPRASPHRLSRLSRPVSAQTAARATTSRTRRPESAGCWVSAASGPRRPSTSRCRRRRSGSASRSSGAP